MTNQRALELLMIERTCVRMGSGMDYDLLKRGYVKTSSECNRDCANCVLVQDSKELLEMYDFVISKMINETENEETAKEWRDWQRNCDPRQPLAI